MKHILILGGSFAGVGTAHQILKQAAKTSLPVKITLVSPNTDMYWNIAAPRAIVPGELADDKIFQPIAAGFSQYPSTKFEFIVASAESLDVEAKKVSISGATGAKTLNYDLLVLATGSSVKEGVPLKSLGSTEATKNALHDYQAQVKKAKTIVIAGAGPTGVEVAGELGSAYGQLKNIVLLASGPTVLDLAPESVSKVTIQQLRNLKVDMKFQTKVISSSQGLEGRQVLTLSGGEQLTTDMYIPTFGVTPNSSYIPAKFLNAEGFVMVDEYLRVKGASNVWAIGDISDREPPQMMPASKQSAHLAKNITLILSNKAPLMHKLGPNGMGLLIGKKAGAGYLSGWKLPGFLVVMIRKTMFIEKLGPAVDGSGY